MIHVVFDVTSETSPDGDVEDAERSSVAPASMDSDGALMVKVRPACAPEDLFTDPLVLSLPLQPCNTDNVKQKTSNPRKWNCEVLRLFVLGTIFSCDSFSIRDRGLSDI